MGVGVGMGGGYVEHNMFLKNATVHRSKMQNSKSKNVIVCSKM